MLPVTAFFAGLFGFFYIGLSVLVILKRYNLRLALGDGGDMGITRRIRAHANFAEYVPFCLILLGINELEKKPGWLVATLAALLLLGRLSHAYGLIVAEAANPQNIKFRQIGMVSTFAVLSIASALLVLGAAHVR